MVRGIRLMTLASLWLVPILIFSTALASDWSSVWETLQVPTWGASFMDLRVITSGVKTQQQGGDPLSSNPTDHWHRPMNYPRIWLHLFSWLGINDSNVSIVGVMLCVFYLSCISWLIIRCESNLQALVLLIAALSLAPLLALERGNTDLIIFSLAVLGCITTNKFLKPGAFFVAAALKIYPFAALLVDSVRRPGKERRVPMALVGIMVAIFAWQWRDLNAIRHGTPTSPTLSYGLLSLRAQSAYLNWELLACFCAAAALIAGIAWLTRPRIDESLLNSKWGEMFSIFGGIYIFTFAIGSNYNYRLIFLIPTLPLVLDLTRSTSYRRWAVIYIASVIAAENSFFFGVYQGTPLADLSTIAIFAMIVTVLLQQAKGFFFGRDGVFQGTASEGALQGSATGDVR
jgi:hypothetical protein